MGRLKEDLAQNQHRLAINRVGDGGGRTIGCKMEIAGAFEPERNDVPPCPAHNRKHAFTGHFEPAVRIALNGRLAHKKFSAFWRRLSRNMGRAANDAHARQWLPRICIENLSANPWGNVGAKGVRLAAQQGEYERKAECEPNHGVNCG